MLHFRNAKEYFENEMSIIIDVSWAILKTGCPIDLLVTPLLGAGCFLMPLDQQPACSDPRAIYVASILQSSRLSLSKQLSSEARVGMKLIEGEKSWL